MWNTKPSALIGTRSLLCGSQKSRMCFPSPLPMAIDVIGRSALRVTWHMSHWLFLVSRGLGVEDLFLGSTAGCIFRLELGRAPLLGEWHWLHLSSPQDRHSGHVGVKYEIQFGNVILNYCHGVDYMFPTSVLRILSMSWHHDESRLREAVKFPPSGFVTFLVYLICYCVTYCDAFVNARSSRS
jgi:hypothetical protein